MIVLGVDPGFSVTGFGVMKREGSRSSVIDYGYLKMSSAQELSARVGIFHDFFDAKIKQYGVTAIALETPFLGKNAQNFLKLGYLRGILYLLADRYHLKLFEFSPREIKLSVTGYGAADKEQVARVMVQLFPGLQMPQKLDVTDALAVTLCGMLKMNHHT